MSDRNYIQVSAQAACQLALLLKDATVVQELTRAADKVGRSNNPNAYHYVHLSPALSARVSKRGG